MKYKVICSDLDGTLLTTKSDVSQETISTFQKLKKTRRIILVSARMPNGMFYLQRALHIFGEPIVCYNGALILDGQSKKFSVTVPINIVQEIHKISEALKTDLGLYYNNEWYVPKDSERVRKETKYTKTKPVFKATNETLSNWKERKVGAHKIMLMGTQESADRLMPILSEKFSGQINLYRSNDTLIEIAPKTVSKLSAIKLLLKEKETLQDVIAFGDNYNDIEMLQHCGLGVAVGNAREEVKAIADEITLKNTDNGVAHFLNNHLEF
ncbi:Cof-type HAD-IIB family hydrolase [Maribacter sp. 2210JD10-5]|uniref:Cof-type HAD-IIB family hydrolase n=1 Tax=Maribacter sp. 2210JD10-5 TaxID=3386272 RepID=UPI0039BD1142